MRDIKFRAWDSDAKQMSYSEGLRHVIYGGASDDIALGIKLHWSVKNSFRGWHRERSFDGDLDSGIISLMQYTGLKDKNGVEWYADDIGEFDNGDRFVLKMEDWLEVYVDWIGDPECEDQARDLYRIERARVIGNIHQHPELLTNKEGE